MLYGCMKALQLKAADPRLQETKAQPFEHQVVCPACHYPFPGAVLEVDHGRIHVRIQHTSHERAAMFVATIPGQSYCPVIAEINDQCRGREGPQLATGPLKYNAESARRKARPLARSTAPRGGAMLGANAKTSPGHSSYPTGSQPLMFRETKAILGKTCVP
jgi:hypothetical protein